MFPSGLFSGDVFRLTGEIYCLPFFRLYSQVNIKYRLCCEVEDVRAVTGFVKN